MGGFWVTPLTSDSVISQPDFSVMFLPFLIKSVKMILIYFSIFLSFSFLFGEKT